MIQMSNPLQSPLLHESDKSFWHGYVDFYGQHLPHVVEGHILEFGVFHGNSIRWLLERHPLARITGADILPVQPDWPVDPRVAYRQVDQSSDRQVEDLFRSIEPPSLIIEDGSHIPSHQARCLRIGLRHLQPGGYYVLEDIHTAHPAHELYQEECARSGPGRSREPRPTVLSLLLCIEHLLRLGEAFGPAHLQQFGTPDFMAPDDLLQIASRIQRVHVYRRSTLPTRCYACASTAFDYGRYRCACGVDLMKVADSMTAVIQVR